VTLRRNAILVITALLAASVSTPTASAAGRCGAGATVVVSRKVHGNKDLWGLNAKGERVRLTTDQRRDAEPSWAPDGRSLVFVRGNEGERELWMLNLATCEETRLTPDDVTPSDPDWGPGGLIAFTNHDKRDSTIDLLDIGTGEISTWVEYGLNPRNPSWSPTGDQIVFEGDTDGDWDLYVAILGTFWGIQITEEPGAEGSPAWSPDDGSIVFTLGTGLYTVDPDGSDVTSLPNTTWTGEPAWTPYGDSILATFEEHIIGFDRDGQHPTAWHIRGRGVDVRPPSSLRLWQDSVAKHSLRLAASAARRYYVDHGTYDGITYLTMEEALPDITWAGGAVDSIGPRFVSVDEQDSTLTATACSNSGVCFAIEETDNAPRPSPWTPDLCTGLQWMPN
jgi:dipeptidyl aminopeptidase/acylaminoacyl peptidase